MQSNLVNPCVAGLWNLELPEGWQLTENRVLADRAESPGPPSAGTGAPGQALPCEGFPGSGNPNAKVPKTAVPETATVKTETGYPPGEAQRCALEKKALQGLARCVRGYTMQEVKRTYEPDPEGGRRLKSEVVTRRTVAPDLDAILFALTNLNPDRWQAKPVPGPAVKNQPGTQRREHSPHPGRTAGRRRARRRYAGRPLDALRCRAGRTLRTARMARRDARSRNQTSNRSRPQPQPRPAR